MDQHEINLDGGSLFSDVADLAIPFGLLLSAKGVAYIANKKKEIVKKGKKAGTKTRMSGGDATAANVVDAAVGGHQSCYLCQQQGGMAKAMLRNEIMQITSDLKALLSDY
jgi:hypothetical protein